MNIPFLTRFCKRRNLHKIRKMMHGYRILKDNGQLGLVRKIKTELAFTEISRVKPLATRFFFGAGKDAAELIVRQYLLARHTRVVLNKVLLYSIGAGNREISYPLPNEFRQVLINNGFTVSHYKSSIIWLGNIILLWCFGITSIVKYLYLSLQRIFSGISLPGLRYVFFIGLQKNNLPRPCKDGRSHDFITWYQNWSGAIKNIDALRHDVKGVEITYLNGKSVEFCRDAVPPLSNFVSFYRFFIWSIGAIFLSGFDILRGRWWNAFLLAEAAKASMVRFSKQGDLAVDYLFDNSDTVYRPAWTYEAEQKGSRIISYFYSIFEDFKLPSGYQPNSTNWRAMNWPLYVVWDEYQEQLVKRNVGETAMVCIAGPIWLSSSPVELPDIPKRAVAVFDIQPVKTSHHFGFSTIAELGYGNPKVPISFINDIDTALSAFNVIMIHKRKRNFGKHVHNGYIRRLAEITDAKRMIAIEPETSPIRVIEKCEAVISMPFTATAIMARELGKPSVFYDPTGLIQKDDRGAHGIPVIRGECELQAWVGKIFSTYNNK